MRFQTITLTAALSVAIALAGCGSDDSGKAKFKVQLSNAAAAMSAAKGGVTAMAAATSFEAQLGGVDLLRDCWSSDGLSNAGCDISVDPDPDIWVNEGCDNDIAKCTSANTEYFELIDPAAANAILNSQGRSIEAGTFTHVRVYFVSQNADDHPIRCNTQLTGIKPSGPVVIKLANPVTVKEGESVTVTVVYDPSGIDCAYGATIDAVLNAMTATVTKN